MGHGPKSRRLTILFFVACLFTYFIFKSFRNLAQRVSEPLYGQQQDQQNNFIIHADTLNGKVIAPKLGNETAKAELGRSAWKLFHTTFARFPDNPTADESLALESYIYLFQRLYPCGECADHFRQILDKFPPQVSSRSNAAAWGCHVHNEVNKSLNKPIFNCAEIGDFYDCGCTDDEEQEKEEEEEEEEEEKEEHTVLNGEPEDSSIAMDEQTPVELQQEEYQRGG